MVIIQGSFKVNPDDRDAYLTQSLEQIETSRAEKGCLEYVLAADPVQADRVVLSERWETMEDLSAHIQGLTARRSEASEEESITPLDTDIALYEVTDSKPLG